MIRQEDLWNENDKATWDLIGSGKTKTVFQLEKSGSRWAKQLKPQTIEELADLISIIRPGCISEDCSIVFSSAKTKRGRENRRMSMQHLYDSWNDGKIHSIISYDQINDCFIKNKIKNIFPTGEKPVWKIDAKRNIKREKASMCQLICTEDHPVLTNLGWKEVGQLKSGDRIAVIKASYSNQVVDAVGVSSYRQICFENYLYKCVFCHWTGGTLDVNHIYENRHVNNSPDNLCFLCPNHHRMFTERTISTEELLLENNKHKLPNSDSLCWYEYVDKYFVGKRRTYDISMNGPFHNFIAGNVVVHNCTDAELDGKSLTQVFADRKNGIMPTEYLHPALEPILKSTYGIIAYQEQAMKIAMDIAGFTEQKADELRKACGKKQVDLMNSLKIDFVNGAVEKGIVSKEITEQIYEWIAASARYSFNLSHAVGYAYLAYQSAYVKAHDLLKTLAVNLSEAHNKPFKMEEIKILVMDARQFGIEVYPPRLDHFYEDFVPNHEKNIIYYGAAHIKDVGSTQYANAKLAIESLRDKIKPSLIDIFYHFFTAKVNKTAFVALASCGLFDGLGYTRNKIIYDFLKWNALQEKEQAIIYSMDVGAQKQSLCQYLERYINTQKINSRRLKTLLSIHSILQSTPRSLEDDNLWLSESEENHMGCAFTCSKVDTYKYLTEITAECQDIASNSMPPTKNVCLGVKIDFVKEYKITSGKSEGQTMCFLTVEDISGQLRSVRVFAEQYEKMKKLLFKGNTVLLYGDVTLKGTDLYFNVNTAKQI